MAKPDLPPNFFTPFFLVCEVPDRLHVWLAKKGNVKTRTSEDGKTIAVAFEPFDFDASISPPLNGWPVYEIHPSDVAQITSFFVDTYDQLFGVLANARGKLAEPSPVDIDSLAPTTNSKPVPAHWAAPPIVAPSVVAPQLANKVLTIPAAVKEQEGPPPALYPHLGDHFGLTLAAVPPNKQE